MSLYQNRYRKALKYGHLLISLVPFIRMIALTGSMASEDGRAITERSDIDFFIQAKKGRIWTTRFFSTTLIWLLRQKRHDRGPTKKIAGRFCLNWYGIKNLPEEGKLPHIILCRSSDPCSLFHITCYTEWILSGKLGDWLENIFRKYQIRRIKRDPRTSQTGSEVRYSDEEIGLHPVKS